MLGLVYPYEVLRQKVLASSATGIIQAEFPLGKPWHALDLLFEAVVAQGATPATTPVVDGLLQAIKSITLTSNKGEIFFKNVPGRAAYLTTIFAVKKGVPLLDSIATEAASNTTTFRCRIRIPFYDPDTYEPSDFLLDTLRYTSMQLQIAMGSISDLYGTVNTATVTWQVTPMLIQEPVPLIQQPHGPTGVKAQKDIASKYLQWSVLNVNDPTAVGFMDLPRSVDVAYMNLYAYYGAGGGSSNPGQGTPTDMSTKFTDWTLEADQDYPIKRILGIQLVKAWQEEIPAFATAFTPGAWWKWRFASEGRKQAALYTGDKSLLRLTYTKPSSGGPSSGDQLMLYAKAWRNLIP